MRTEPIVLTIPPMGTRHYWYPIGDMHHDFSANLSWDTVGSHGGNFAFCPPGWQGVLPEGVRRIDVSTPIIWVAGRFAVDGVDDIPAATKLQDQTKLVPLSRWGQSEVARPKIDPAAYPALSRTDLTDARKYFTTLNAVLRLAPRANNPVDEGIFGWLREINMHPSQAFDWNTLSPASQRGLERAAKEGHRIISERQRRAVPIVNHWQIARLEKKGSHDPAKRADWLPAPEGPFYLVMRHYSPKEPIITGDWVPPPVQKR